MAKGALNIRPASAAAALARVASKSCGWSGIIVLGISGDLFLPVGLLNHLARCKANPLLSESDIRKTCERAGEPALLAGGKHLVTEAFALGFLSAAGCACAADKVRELVRQTRMELRNVALCN